MQVTVLVIESGAEAALVCAALARRPEVRVVDAAGPGRRAAAARRQRPVAGDRRAAALAESADELVKRLGGTGVPVIGVTIGLAPAARQRALAAGVREIHERPAGWPPYAELIDSLVGRFTRTGSAPRRGRTR